MQEMKAVARLQEGMRFAVESGTGHMVMLDEQYEGVPSAGFSPMEMLLIGLAGCTGISVLSILRKKRQAVSGYELRVHGVRATEHPKVFVEIAVEHIIMGHAIQPQAIARAIELSETRYCGAEAMLGKTAKLVHAYRIVEQEAEK